MKRVENLEESERKAVVRTLKRLKALGCRFRLVESGNHAFLWITKSVGGEEVRRSITAPDGVEDLLRRAGVLGGATSSPEPGREQVQVA